MILSLLSQSKKKMKNLIFVLFLVFGFTFSLTFAEFSDSEQSLYASAIAKGVSRWDF